jgi:murein DD-endopeptidase MepM/ murein hydrolase activator NlpD
MYFHLSKVFVKQGARIEKGQVIGLVGATGRASGPHLHWGLRMNDARVNPMAITRLHLGKLPE